MSTKDLDEWCRERRLAARDADYTRLKLVAEHLDPRLKSGFGIALRRSVRQANRADLPASESRDTGQSWGVHATRVSV